MKITFCGDICVNHPLSYITVDDTVSHWLRQSDYTLCCFEAPLLTQKHHPITKSGPHLLQEKGIESLLPYFTHASLANNHALDYGEEGCKETVINLKQNGIIPMGVGSCLDEAYRPTILQDHETSVAIFCWGEAQFGCLKSEEQPYGHAWILHPYNAIRIAEAKKRYDYVVLFLHAGLEMEDHPLPEWRDLYHNFIDAGADLIIAGHPHVIQGCETYRGKSIYYSLGNFFFNNDESDPRWNQSLMVTCSISSSGIQTEEHFCQRIDNHITVLNTPPSNYPYLCSLLKEENRNTYLTTVNEMVLSCWERYYRGYYSFPIERTFRFAHNPIRRITQPIIRRLCQQAYLPASAPVFLYHNIMVDTHRFAVGRALSIIAHTY